MNIILHVQSAVYHAVATITVNVAIATCTGSVQLIKLMDPYWGMAHIIAAFNAIVTQKAMMGMKARHLGLERERAAQLSMQSLAVIVTPKPRLPALERERPAQLSMKSQAVIATPEQGLLALERVRVAQLVIQ
jgi:hypothetical protein